MTLLKVGRWTVAFLILAAASGCGKSQAPTGIVEGQVLVAGNNPGEELRIVFYNSMSGQGGASLTGDEGKFKLPEPLPIGEYTVFFEKLLKEKVETESDSPPLSIDPSYSTEENSPVKLVVKEGPNSFEIDVPSALSKKKRKR